jgi:hypothetical protein
MDFIRPELLSGFIRFRDAIAGVGVSVLGVYWALSSSGGLAIIGISLAVAGALLVFAGIQRGRFRTGAGGLGVVMVDEGQVTYYGPREGGSAIISELQRVELNPAAEYSPEWILHQPDNGPLRIPTNAEALRHCLMCFPVWMACKLKKCWQHWKRQKVSRWKSGARRAALD